MTPSKIVSGGQTGMDRAALDFAIGHNITHGGWCPLARLAEDGPIPPRYQLTETPSADPIQRTEWNVRDSDATVIFSISKVLGGGSRQTFEFAKAHGKPCLHLSAEADGARAAILLTAFLRAHRPRTLNVAGPRASDERDAGQFCREVLARALSAKAG